VPVSVIYNFKVVNVDDCRAEVVFVSLRIVICTAQNVTHTVAVVQFRKFIIVRYFMKVVLALDDIVCVENKKYRNEAEYEHTVAAVKNEGGGFI